MTDNKQPQPTIVVNHRVITFVLGIIAVMSMMATMVTMWNTYAIKVDQLELRNAELLTEVNKLNGRIEDLSSSIVELTITLNRIDDRTRK